MQVERPGKVPRINTGLHRSTASRPKKDQQHSLPPHCIDTPTTSSSSSSSSTNSGNNNNNNNNNNNSTPREGRRHSPSNASSTSPSSSSRPQKSHVPRGRQDHHHQPIPVSIDLDQDEPQESILQTRDMNRAPHRSGAKRTIRPLSSQVLEELESVPSSSPRPSDQDEAWGLPSPQWKRARVQGQGQSLDQVQDQDQDQQDQECIELDPDHSCEYDHEVRDGQEDSIFSETISSSYSALPVEAIIICQDDFEPSDSEESSTPSTSTLLHPHTHSRLQQPLFRPQPTSNTNVHSRNFSSPSLLDSFTSPEPMLSPIQSYFGSDPNSPASTFSLPRHDHYPRLSADHFMDGTGDAGWMDAYHGYATHPWSEQSTTPSRALSHRWTRRSSQSDAYPTAAPSRLRPTSAVLSRPFAPASMDEPWHESRSGAIEVTHGPSVGSADYMHDVDRDVLHSEGQSQEQEQEQEHDSVQDQSDEVAMDESYGGYEATYDHNYDYNHNLRNSDSDQDLEDDEIYPYGYRATSLDEDPDRDEYTSLDEGEASLYARDGPEDSDEAEEDYGVESQLYGTSLDGSELIGQEDDFGAATEDDSDLAHILGLDRPRRNLSVSRQRSSNSVSTLASSSAQSHRGRSQSHQASAEVEGPETDEMLARRLQDEEYSAALGRRDILGGTSFSSSYPYHPHRHRHQNIARTIPHYRRPTLSSSRAVRTDMDQRDTYSTLRWGDQESHTGSGLARFLVRPRASGHSTAARHDREGPLGLGLLATRTPSSRSPSLSTSLAASEGLQLRDEVRILARALEHQSRILVRYNEARQRDGLDGMWGNPNDYLNDDQVDDSYEGLLRLSEQIGDAKPKGVPMHTLRKMGRHAASWEQMRAARGSQSSRMFTKKTLPIRSIPPLSKTRNETGLGGMVQSAGEAAAEDASDENCTICLQVYDLSDQLQPLPCRHAFHVDCIKTWLGTNAQCPICRQEVTAESVNSMS